MSNHKQALDHLFLTRRELLCRCGMGLGTVGLTALLQDWGFLGRAEAATSLKPLAPRKPQFPAKAKRVIHLFMNGGPSHVDTFDPKPALQKYASKSLPSPNLRTERKT